MGILLSPTIETHQHGNPQENWKGPALPGRRERFEMYRTINKSVINSPKHQMCKITSRNQNRRPLLSRYIFGNVAHTIISVPYILFFFNENFTKMMEIPEVVGREYI